MTTKMLKNKFGKRSPKAYEDIWHTCTVRFLDDEDCILQFKKEDKGQKLINDVCEKYNLEESSYFGLRFMDNDKQRHWLDPLKSVYKQIKHVEPLVLCFRVKFYPSDPLKLKEELTRYYLFLQLRRDLHHGRLLCSASEANTLAAYIIQADLGDYDPQDHHPGYVSEFDKMLPKQSQKQEEKIAEIHKTLVGQVPSDAENNFLAKAATLDTYGVDPHPVKDQKGNQMYLGVTHLGIVTFQGNKRTHLFKWAQINKITFEGKMFIVNVTVNEKKHACGFKCSTFASCKHLWKCAVEQQYFFTLNSSSEAPKVTSGGGWFTRGSKFRFSGRCQKEVYTESAQLSRTPPEFVRSSSNSALSNTLTRNKTNSLPASFKEKKVNDEEDPEVTPEEKIKQDDTLDGTIPEEPNLTISETVYAPLQSPQQNDLPPIPINHDKEELNPDLDIQIEELQTELEKCRQANANSEIPMNSTMLSEEEPVVIKAKPKPSRIGGIVKVLALLFFITFLTTVVVSLIVLESDLDLPVVNDLRGMPEVQQFRSEHYEPARGKVIALFQ